MKNIFLLFIIISFACAQEKEQIMTDATDVVAVAEESQSPSSLDVYAYTNAKLIKTANYRFNVSDVKKSTETIEIALKKYPAYVSASDLTLQGSYLENKMTLRVQNEYFIDLLKDIDKEAVFVNFRNVQTEDVSKDFVDLESRLQTKREVEERYKEILRKKAGTIKELLEAERQIGVLHEEIEATISRLNYLKNQVRYSTINLEFYQTITNNALARQDENWMGKFCTAFESGWKGLVQVTVALVYVWPLFVLAAVVYVIFKWRRLLVKQAWKN